MRRFFITLAYNGLKYCGWQIQPNDLSVQEVVQNAISTILRKQILIVGAGRTDSGVHAKEMIAHFDWDSNSDINLNELTLRLNRFLPKDIVILNIKEVEDTAHARFSALSRTYSYHVTTTKDPFNHHLKYRIFYEPNIGLMNSLCQILMNTSDFTSFSKLHTDVKTNICDVKYAKWEKVDDNYIFIIIADRFLRNMVRSIVGTLLEAGRECINKDDFINIIESKNRGVAGESVPAHALFLEKVEYPESIWL